MSRLQPPIGVATSPARSLVSNRALKRQRTASKRFNPLVASAKPKRRQSSDTHNLAIANRTGSTARRQRSTPLLVLNLEMNHAPCLWQSGHLLIHSLRPSQKIRTQPSRCCGASPFRLMILYRGHVLIGYLFDSPLVSKLQNTSRKITAWLWQPPRCPTSNHSVQACNLARAVGWPQNVLRAVLP